jgi:hypothetical protein
MENSNQNLIVFDPNLYQSLLKQLSEQKVLLSKEFFEFIKLYNLTKYKEYIILKTPLNFIKQHNLDYYDIFVEFASGCHQFGFDFYFKCYIQLFYSELEKYF